MKKLALIFVSILLTGCGTFQLGTVYSIKGQSVQQRETDMLICKDNAKNEANTTARVAGSFVAGLTIIGAPIAIEEEKRKTREVFAECMEKRGYRVTPPQ
jgi:hypothetical protein